MWWEMSFRASHPLFHISGRSGDETDTYCIAENFRGRKLKWITSKERLDVYEAKIEESEKAGSRWELNPGHLACAASALPLSYDNWTTANPHNPPLWLFVKVFSVKFRGVASIGCISGSFLPRKQETFEGKNFSKFCGFKDIRESFLCEI